MSRLPLPRLFARTAACAALLFAPLLFTPLCGHAAPLAAPKPLHLPASTLSQIAALEQEADSRTPAQQKISSQLVYALKMARGEQIAPGIPVLRTTVQMDSRGLALVDIDADVTPDLLYAITRSGGSVVNTSERFGAVRASVPLASLETLAMVPGVRFIRTAAKGYPQNPAPLKRTARTDFLAPFVLPVPERMSLPQKAAALRVNLPGLLARVRAIAPGPQTNVGSVVDEGDKTHQADKARSSFGIDGSGIKVGVLSDSIDDSNGSYAAAVQSGDVSAVTVISGQAGSGEGEGLAMEEVVHHLAPGAKLYFATAEGGNAKFADNIIALQKAGCKVIVDDFFAQNDSPLQDGVISQAVDTVTAAGTMYFSCAVNDGNLDDGTASVWEGDFVDSGDRSFGDGDIHTFDSSQGGPGEVNSIEANTQNGDTTVELYWSDPLGKSSNDYDLAILDSGYNIVSSSTDRQTGSQDPYEVADAANGDYAIIIKHSGSTRFLHLLIDTQHSIFHFVTNGRVSGHNSTANAFCVAATPAANNQNGDTQGPYPDPFNSSDVVETFSCDGPRRVFYDPTGKAYTSSLTHTGGKLLSKPDFTAADGTSSTLPAGGGLNPFFGTSCATPHAGAIAALVLSYNPSLTRAQLATILDGSATDIMASGDDRDAGYGILNAYKALQNTPSGSTVKPKSLSFSPNPVIGGQDTTGTLTLTGAAPSGGAAVTITENGSSIGTVTVPAGSTGVTFTLTPPVVTTSETDTIGAVYNGATVTTSLTVNPAASSVTISSLVLTPTSVTAGGTSSGKITLSAVAPSGGATIALKSSDTSVATVSPSSVTIAAGNKSISFTVTSKSVTSTKTVTITATVGSSSKTATLTVTPAVTATVKSLSVSPTSVVGGSANSTGTVTLTAAAPSGGLAVTLKSSDTSSATVASTLNIAAGATSAAFKITTKTVTGTKTVTITATAGSTSKTATLTVTKASSGVTASALSFDPNSISSDGMTTGTITLSGNAPSGGAAVALSSGGSAIETVTVPAGKSSTTFPLFSGVVPSTETDTIDAAYGGKTVSADLTIKATTVKPTKISLSPSTVSGGGSTTVTITLSTTAPKGGAVVEIYQGSTDLGYALVAGGQTSVSVSYAPATVTKTTTYTEKATYNNISVTTTLTVKP